MTIEERIADLERRMTGVERITTPLMPLGPRHDHEELDRERREGVERIKQALMVGAAAGWFCTNCGKVHAPDVPTCPEPAKDGSLRQRLGTVSNG